MTNSSSPEIEAVRRKAAGSSFYSAMRLMPKAEREAMFAIYAFCRAVDDIADDGVGTRAERRAQLDQWRADVERALCGRSAGPVPRFWPRRWRSIGLRQEDFLAVIDGMDMDVDGGYHRARSRHARSLLRPRGERGRTALDQGVRHGGRAGLRVGASSGPRIAAHQHPARSGRGRRRSSALSAARISKRSRASPKTHSLIRRSMPPAAASPTSRMIIMRKRTSSCARGPGAIFARHG